MTGIRLMDWTPEDHNRLRELVEAGLTFGEIAKLTPGRTRNAIIGKAHRLGLQSSGKPGAPKQSNPKKKAMPKKRSNFTLSHPRKRKPYRPPAVAECRVPAPITPINGEGITIVDLRPNQCHAVMGSSRPAVGLPLYCGHPAWRETAYCEGHYAAFHQLPKYR